ncbi:MAG: BatD family protein [Verrucomicrobiales bacterium]|nr:BatD family protein [Verrucomicrobiales bacterium]
MRTLVMTHHSSIDTTLSRLIGRSYPLVTLLAVILFTLSSDLAPAQQISNATKITGLLHGRKLAVGEKGVYAIQVDNGTLDETPKSIEAPGLTILYQGQNSSIKVINGVSSSQTIYYYRLSGDQEGSFTIPVVSLNVRGKTYSTQAATLVIFKRKAGDLTLDASKPYFLRLTTPKTSLYVNQIVPLDLTAFVRGQSSIYEIGAPNLKNEGLVIKPFQRNVAQGNLVIDGYEYSTAKIQGSVYPIQPGEQILKSAELRCRFIDRNARSGGGLRSLFTQTVTRTLQSNALSFDVKPLPKEGKPSTFSGAVGNFDMEIHASPLKLQSGDPISIDITITGVGNFDALAAPTFLSEGSSQWRTYEARKIIDPNEKSDGVLSGKCTFTQIVIPSGDITELPPFEISFFDPETEQYVTRRSQAIPLEIAADTRAASAVSSVAGGHATSQAAVASPLANFDDILFIRQGKPHRRNLQANLTQRPSFWLTQLVPLLLLLWILAIALRRFIKIKGYGTNNTDTSLDFQQLRQALAQSTSTRADYYKNISACLDRWQQQTQSKPKPSSEAITAGFQALYSRCQWILYGAPESDRQAAPTDRETSEAKQILDTLSQHLSAS